VNGQKMTSLNNQQRGNTLLGLIIGALVGLGAALAVAVYVTKVPVPFLNKTQPRSADSDAAETKKNKDWDPNMPLAGKNPVKPAPAASGPIGTATAAPPTPAASSAVAGKPKVSADPLGDLAKAKSEAKPDAAGSVSNAPNCLCWVFRPKSPSMSSRVVLCTGCAWGHLTKKTKRIKPRKSWMPSRLKPHWFGSSAELY
jgi:hypothetical protein